MKILSFIVVFVLSLVASVDINKANVKELTSLNGVGAKKAEVIVQHRKDYGCFLTVDSLAKVKGIGLKTVEKNRDNLVASKCKK